MEIQKHLVNYQQNLKKRTSKHQHYWQSVAEEMTDWFGTNCFWLFWKYPLNHIKTEYECCKRDNDHTFRNLLYKIRKPKIMLQKEIAERVLSHYKQGEIQKACNTLLAGKGLLKKETYDYLVNKLSWPEEIKKKLTRSKVLLEAQKHFGGKFVD